MPKAVDHDERRSEVAHAARRVVLRRGMERTTLRDVAAEAGWSVGVLAHYFSSKDELLKFALTDATGQAELQPLPSEGIASARAMLASILPLNDRMREMWGVWMNFWVSSPGDAEWEAEREKLQTAFRRRCAELVRHGQERQDFRADLDAEEQGDRLAALIHGISVSTILNPKAWPRETQLAFLDEYLNGLRTPA